MVDILFLGNRVSNRLCPAALVIGISPDSHIYCRAPFGEYYHIYISTSKDVMVSRALGGLNVELTGKR